jgi:pyruvate dehydrogenase E1 component beta subunit
VPLVIRSVINRGGEQGAQHSQALHAMFMHVPGLKVVAPSNAHDVKGCMIAAIRDDNPVIFVEHRLLYYTDAYVPEESFTVPFGKARRRTEGDDITIVGISNMVMECLRAHELLAEIGIDAEIIDPISLVPLDTDTIAESARRTGRLLVVDNAWTMCGASAEIVARVLEQMANEDRLVKVRRMGYAPTTCPTTPSLEREFYADAEKIAQAAHAMVRPDQSWAPDPERAKLAYQAKFRGPF